MKYFLISDDKDTLTGLRLVGIGGVLCRDAREVNRELDRVIADESIAVLVMTNECASMCRKRIDDLRLSAQRPLVTIISGSGSKIEPDSITRLIREAIGIKL